MRLKALKTLAFPDLACAAGRYFTCPDERAKELIEQGIAEDATPKKAKAQKLEAEPEPEEQESEGSEEDQGSEGATPKKAKGKGKRS